MWWKGITRLLLHDWGETFLLPPSKLSALLAPRSFGHAFLWLRNFTAPGRSGAGGQPIKQPI